MAAVLGASVLAMLTPAPTQGLPTGRTNAAASAVVTALTDGLSTAAVARLIPADFTAVMRYAPVIENGLIVNPTGGCSSPITLPPEFELPCRAHDFGYDMLRYAARTGAPLPGSARRALDAEFGRTLFRSCSSGWRAHRCKTFATIALTAVEVNSWRQHWQPPRTEADGVAVASWLTGGHRW